jgi:ribose 5-phosphate isomerase A
LEAHGTIDLTIDGADEVDPQMDLIKGGGGALLREKIVASASRREIIIVDSSKLSDRLGTRFALPVEVIPFAWTVEHRFLHGLGADAQLRSHGNVPFRTDHGNYILDCRFPPIHDAYSLSRQLDARPGIVAHGLFLGVATDLIIASPTGIRHQTR